MFLHVSVILFTGGAGRSLCPSMHHRSHDKGGSLSGRGLSPGGSLSRAVQGRSLSGGSLSGGVSVRETPRTVTSGQYASYWNAFFLQQTSKDASVQWAFNAHAPDDNWRHLLVAFGVFLPSSSYVLAPLSKTFPSSSHIFQLPFFLYWSVQVKFKDNSFL